MTLTVTPIEDVLRTGTAEQSPLAKELLSRILDECGIRTVACYLDTSSCLVLPPRRTVASLVRRGPIAFACETVLSLYIRTEDPFDFDDAAQKEHLYGIFCRTAKERNIPLSYPRRYLPEEMAYYGWQNKRREDWDFSRVIPSRTPTADRHCVHIESVDHLALRQYLYPYKDALTRSPLLRQYGARAYFGYRDTDFRPTYYVILPHGVRDTLDTAAYAAEIAAQVCRVLCPRDRFGVITPESVHPVLTEWDALTPEMRFSLTRE